MKSNIYGGFLLVGLVFMVLVGLIVGGAYWSESSNCKEIGALTGNQTHMSISTGCLVKMDGRWLTREAAMSNARELTIKEKP